MSEHIAEREPGPLELLAQLERAGVLSSTGLLLDDPKLPYERYEAMGRMLGLLADVIRFAIGDWLIFGEAVYGEKAAQAAEATGRAKGTLADYLRVAMYVPRSRRRADLSWSHHRRVCALEPAEQTRWLTRAAEQRWSVEELAGQLSKKAPLTELDAPPQDSAGSRQAAGLQHGDDGRAVVNGVVVEELENVARALWRSGQPTGDGAVLVAAEPWARLGAVLGEEGE